MSGIKAKISETVDKLTHRSGTNANTTGTHGTGTTGSGYDNTSSGYSSGNTGNLDTTGTTGTTDYNTTSGTGMGTTGTGMGTTGTDMGTGASDGTGYTTTGTTDYGTTGATNYGTTGTTGASMGTGQVIDSETFTKTEDHERLVEKKKYELEHHPVEKKYVVETKFVGEQGVAGAPTEVVGHESNIVDERVQQAPAGDRTVVVENVDVPASELRSTTGTTGMGTTSGTGMGTGTGQTY